MEFQEAKLLVKQMKRQPYLINQNISLFCPNWIGSLEHIIEDLNNKFENEENTDVSPVSSEYDIQTVKFGLTLLPAVMLQEDTAEAWEIYTAVNLLAQNYAIAFDNESLLELVSATQKLIVMKGSLEALMLQSESLILQTQAVVKNSSVPYKLSKRFLTSILGDEESNV